MTAITLDQARVLGDAFVSVDIGGVLNQIRLKVGEAPQHIENQRLDQIRFDSWAAEAVKYVAAGAFTVRADGEQERADAISASNGKTFARDLDFTIQEVLREPTPTMSASSFPSKRIPAGAETYTHIRQVSTGNAVLWRDGMQIPTLDWNRDRETRPIGYMAVGVRTSMMGDLALSYAGLNDLAEKMKEVKPAFERLQHEVFWYGNEAHNLRGVVGYDDMMEMYPATPITSASTGAEILAALNQVCNSVKRKSKQVFSFNKLRAATYIVRTLRETYVDPTSGNTERLYDAFLKSRPEITEIIEDSALDDIGVGNAFQGFLLYRDDSQGIQRVDGLPFTAVPVQTNGLQTTYAFIQGVGGACMPYPGNMLLAYFEVDT